MYCCFEERYVVSKIFRGVIMNECICIVLLKINFRRITSNPAPIIYKVHKIPTKPLVITRGAGDLW